MAVQPTIALTSIISDSQMQISKSKGFGLRNELPWLVPTPHRNPYQILLLSLVPPICGSRARFLDAFCIAERLRRVLNRLARPPAAD